MSLLGGRYTRMPMCCHREFFLRRGMSKNSLFSSLRPCEVGCVFSPLVDVHYWVCTVLLFWYSGTSLPHCEAGMPQYAARLILIDGRVCLVRSCRCGNFRLSADSRQCEKQDRTRFSYAISIAAAEPKRNSILPKQLR